MHRAPASHLTGLLLSPYRPVCNLLASKSFTNICELTKSARELNSFHIVKGELDSEQKLPQEVNGVCILHWSSSEAGWDDIKHIFQPQVLASLLQDKFGSSPTQVIYSALHCMEVCAFLQKTVQSGDPTL